MNIIQSVSVYAPIIITFSILFLGFFSNTLINSLFFIFWVLVVTVIRIGVLWMLNTPDISTWCSASAKLGLPYTSTTYSTFMLCFSTLYLILPTVFAGSETNYALLTSMLVYITLDIFVKKSVGCIGTLHSLVGDFIGGAGLGAAVAALVYNSPMREYLFITVAQSASKKMKCTVCKGGTPVTSKKD